MMSSIHKIIGLLLKFIFISLIYIIKFIFKKNSYFYIYNKQIAIYIIIQSINLIQKKKMYIIHFNY